LKEQGRLWRQQKKRRHRPVYPRMGHLVDSEPQTGIGDLIHDFAKNE